MLITLLLNFSLLSGAEKIIDQNTIYKNLRCLVCQGQTIHESNAEIAEDLKTLIREKIVEGKTDKEIKGFLVEKYGDWIVYKPPFNKINFLLWVLPYLVLVIGGAFIFFLHFHTVFR